MRALCGAILAAAVALATLPAMAMNHNLLAPRAKCPAYFNGGLVDPVSPAYSTYAAFLLWGGKDKTFVAVPNHGHDWWAAFDRAAYRWLDRVLGDEKRTGGCQ